MVSGDVWVGDLIGSDDTTFLFSSVRHGQIRVNRDAVYTLGRRQHPNLVFDGSQLKHWDLSRDDESEEPRRSGIDAEPSWRPDSGGHPHTDRAKAEIFSARDWPKRFEMDLEFVSTEAPGFVLAFSKDQEQALRLETWANELVVVQDKLFEPVLTIEKDQRDVRLRLAFDGVAGVTKVFDSTGRLLVKVDGVRPVQADAGLYIRNRGQDLTVRRLSVYRQTAEGATQQVDPSRPRVHMIDGHVVYGRLFTEEGGAYVLDADQTRRDIDLKQVDRIARPDINLAQAVDSAELTYADGTVVRGRVQQLNSERVILATGFADTPVTCALAGASALRLGPLRSTGEPHEPSRDDDQLTCASGRLRGRLTFEAAGSPLRWKPEGAAGPLRLADTGVARIERSRQRVSNEPCFRAEEFPHTLYLKNGEVIPCRVESYDENTIAFESPFLSERKMDSAHVKGIEFTGGTLVERGKEPVIIDGVRLERALTVPRFSRDSPPSHILVAKTGDLKRGSLRGIRAQTIQFESKLRELAVPVHRVARVVDVSKPEEDTDEPAAISGSPEGTVRATLVDGSILVFEARESRDGRLLGQSPIYGEMTIPIASIRRVNFGGFEKEKFEPTFEEWVVRPGREPEFGKQP